MTILSFPDTDAIARLCTTAAADGLWQGIALAVAAALALRLAPRTSATARFFLWSAVLLGAVLLPFFHVSSAVPAAASQPHPLSLLRLSPLWSFGIAALWLLLSLLRLLQLAVQGVRLHNLWRGAQPIVTAPEIATILARVPLRRVELCLSSAVDRPSVIGFFAPRILIPDWLFNQLTPPELVQIVLHEIEHLRRADDWLNLLQKLSLALFPLNPALVWIERRLCTERELACDDGVLRVTLAPRVYATCLTTLAERRLEHRSVLSLALGTLGALGRSELSRRVYSILNRPPSLSPARARAVTAMLAIGLIGCAAVLARSPQLVSFASPSPAPQTSASTTSRPWKTAAFDQPLAFLNAAFHIPGNRDEAALQPRMTLLKASSVELAPTSKRLASQRLPASRPQSIEARASQPAAVTSQPAPGYVVMTSWTLTQTVSSQLAVDADAARPAMTRMIVTVARMPVRTTDETPVAAQVQSLDHARDPLPAENKSQDRPINPERWQMPRQVQARQVSPRYAAVPTDLGWLILEL